MLPAGELDVPACVALSWTNPQVAALVPHGFAADPAHAALLALNAGTDMEMVSTCFADPARRWTVEASVMVRNTGDRHGDEVVQPCLHDPGAGMVQPVRRLRGFRRPGLAPGEITSVRFVLGAVDVGFWTNAPEGEFVVEPRRHPRPRLLQLPYRGHGVRPDDRVAAGGSCTACCRVTSSRA
ncbi:fibronectin type III-like domain-contianing protein [Streptomyces sp. NPDC059909]|uniref:fibronectin type III-like domain-contianing protein n=1 Tax=Streptomyces sp. NPDC059909 TaxID=3346998 RepID=UPI0036508D61